MFVPGYRCSPRYVQNVNITNTRVVNVTQVTNVYNNVYINHNTTVINNYTYARNETAVTAVSRDTFVNARPVCGAAIRRRQNSKRASGEPLFRLRSEVAPPPPEPAFHLSPPLGASSTKSAPRKRSVRSASESARARAAEPAVSRHSGSARYESPGTVTAQRSRPGQPRNTTSRGSNRNGNNAQTPVNNAEGQPPHAAETIHRSQQSAAKHAAVAQRFPAVPTRPLAQRTVRTAFHRSHATNRRITNNQTTQGATQNSGRAQRRTIIAQRNANDEQHGRKLGELRRPHPPLNQIGRANSRQ